MENKKNVVLVASTNFYVLKKNPKVISYKEIENSEKNDWHKIKLSIDLNNYTPKDDELMFMVAVVTRTQLI